VSTVVVDVASSTSPGAPRAGAPSAWRAALLNVLLPGLGYLYLGRLDVAILAFAASWVWVPTLLGLTLVVPGPGLRIALTVLVILVPLVALPIHSVRLARRTTAAPRVYQRWYLLLGVWLVAVLFVNPVTILRAGVMNAFRIPNGSSSMVPSLLPGDYLFVAPRVPQLRRGQAVTYRPSHERYLLIHRLVGLPGDRLSMRDFHLVVNGRPADEHMLITHDGLDATETDSMFEWQRGHLAPGADAQGYRPTYGNWGPIVLGRNEYFILGDNRRNSLDSRFRGPVGRAALVGHPEWIYFSYDSTEDRVRWERIGQRVE